MPLPIPPSEPRSRKQLRRHYEVERELAQRLRNAPPEARRRLYGEVYDELLERLPDQPMLRQARDPEARTNSAALQLTLLEPFLEADTRFVEFGAGDTSLARALAPRVRQTIVIEASRRIAGTAVRSEELRFLRGDATRIDLPPESIDLAYKLPLPRVPPSR